MSGLRSIRKESKITQAQLASMAHVGLATVRRIEAGKNVNVSVLKRIAHTLGCPVDDLLEKDGKEGKAG